MRLLLILLIPTVACSVPSARTAKSIRAVATVYEIESTDGHTCRVAGFGLEGEKTPRPFTCSWTRK